MSRIVSALVLGAALMLPGGCVGLVAAGSAIGAASGALAVAQNSALLFGDTLSDAAKIACAVQAIANERGDTELSRKVGAFCAW